MKNKNINRCITTAKVVNGKLILQIKKKGCKSAQELLDSIKTKKITYK